MVTPGDIDYFFAGEIAALLVNCEGPSQLLLVYEKMSDDQILSN